MFCSCSTIEDLSYFKEELFRDYPEGLMAIREDRSPGDHPVMTALGDMVILAAENFTTCIQPVVMAGRVVYAVTRYGSHRIRIVRDCSDLPFPKDERENWNVLPLGLRKAAALENSIHQEILEQIDGELLSHSEDYFTPRRPYDAIKWARRLKRLAKTPAARRCLRCLGTLDRAGVIASLNRLTYRLEHILDKLKELAWIALYIIVMVAIAILNFMLRGD